MNRSFFNRFPEYSISYEQWIEKFLNRINEMIFSTFEKWYHYDKDFIKLCGSLWYKSDDYRIQNYWVWNNYKWLESLTKRDLWETLNLLEYIWKDYYEYIEAIIKLSRTKDDIDLWIRFHNWIFYKAWDEELDKMIINKSIDNISLYEKAEIHYSKALKNYSSWNYPEALTNCYTTIEKLAQNILSNKKTLLKNQNDLVSFLKKWNDNGFVKEWREIIKHLCNYLQDFSTRHWSNIEKIDEVEVDATIYLIWIIINLLSKKIRYK